nr:uncharacterized protein LOC108077677 [Drosophila kikkawai]
MDPLELLKQGSEITMSNLANLLSDHGNRMKDEKFLPALIARAGCIYDIDDVLDYAYRNLTEKEYESCITNLVIQKTLVCLPDRKLSISLYLQLLLHGEPTTGLARIEASCVYYLGGAEERNARIRRLTIENLNEYGNTETKTKVFKELLKINEKLSMEHPHYTENSEVHRQKMRIAFALITIHEYCDDPLSLKTLLLPSDHCDDPRFLKTLLLPSDHLGINLMHEFLVGTCVENIDWVLEALPRLRARQQESYLSIAYIFIFKNLRKIKKDKLSEMFTSLLPLTMGSCYEVRTLAQIILHRLALECELNSIHIPVAESLISTVETLLGEKLYELQIEPRLMLAELSLYCRDNISALIRHITNAPFDERYGQFEPVPKVVWNKIITARQAFRARKLLSTAHFAPSNNLRIKLPITPAKEVKSESSQRERIVVASLLDNETNFTRLRLICQRFGVDTLVLDEESHLKEFDSCNLRIRRVNPTSLVEFLLTKRNEGYEIRGCIGIEGISKVFRLSVEDGVILVLGHKELGIPAEVNKILENPVIIKKINVFKTFFAKSVD